MKKALQKWFVNFSNVVSSFKNFTVAKQANISFKIGKPTYTTAALTQLLFED